MRVLIADDHRLMVEGTKQALEKAGGFKVVGEAVFTTVGVSDEPGERAAKEAGLTELELVIVRAVARGLSNEAIAKELWVAEQTVKFHLTNIYRKLEVSNRTEAARYAFEQGLVEHGSDGPGR